MKISDGIKLNNGYEIPCLGFGTCKALEVESTESVKWAIENGYRHIDCASRYGNEKFVGNGIKKGIEKAGIKREELFITSKVWKSDIKYDQTIKSFKQTLKDLQLEYLDLFLIHWPVSPVKDKDYIKKNKETWRALTDLYKDGYVKAIGVSNFEKHHMDPLLDMEIKPMVNQIEAHPGYMQDEVREYCKENEIVVEGWSPLGRGRVMTYPLLIVLSEKYGKSVAQVCLRYLLQKDIVPLPKSVTESRIIDNGNIFDFELTEADVKMIDGIEPCGFSGLGPDLFPTFSEKVKRKIKSIIK